MKKKIVLALVFTCFVLLLVFICFVILHAENKTLKILTIGNSFADSARRYLPQVAESANCKVEFGRANMSGCSLDRHWDSHLKSEKDTQYKPYPGEKTLIELLQEKKWDIVTMQQVSSKSFKLETYEPYFKNIYELVKKHAPQAEIVIQMTWSYRPEHNAFGRWGVSDQNDMYNKLFKAYSDIAAKYKCRLIPVGHSYSISTKRTRTKI